MKPVRKKASSSSAPDCDWQGMFERLEQRLVSLEAAVREKKAPAVEEPEDEPFGPFDVFEGIKEIYLSTDVSDRPEVRMALARKFDRLKKEPFGIMTPSECRRFLTLACLGRWITGPDSTLDKLLTRELELAVTAAGGVERRRPPREGEIRRLLVKALSKSLSEEE